MDVNLEVHKLFSDLWMEKKITRNEFWTICFISYIIQKEMSLCILEDNKVLLDLFDNNADLEIEFGAKELLKLSTDMDMWKVCRAIRSLMAKKIPFYGKYEDVLVKKMTTTAAKRIKLLINNKFITRLAGAELGFMLCSMGICSIYSEDKVICGNQK